MDRERLRTLTKWVGSQTFNVVTVCEQQFNMSEWLGIDMNQIRI